MGENKNLYDENGFYKENHTREYYNVMDVPVQRLVNTMNVLLNVNPENLLKIPDIYLRDKETVSTIASMHPEILEQTPQYTNDKEFMSNVIAQNPKAIQYASDELLNDEYFILHNLQDNPDIIKYIDPAIIEQMYVRELIDTEPKCAKYLPDLDREYILWAIEMDGKVLDDFPEMQKDEDIIRLAAKTSPETALKYATKEMYQDKDWLKSILDNEIDFKNMPETVKNDPELIKIVMEQTYNINDVFKNVSEKIRGDKDFILALLKEHYHIDPQYIDQSLYQDKNFMMQAINYNNDFYFYADRNDPDIVKAVLEYQDDVIVAKIPTEMWHDKEIRSLLSPCYYEDLPEAAKEIFKEDHELMLDLIRKNPTILVSLSDENKRNTYVADKDFAITLVDKEPYILPYLNDFIHDKDVVMTAVKGDVRTSSYIPPELRNDETFALELVDYNPILYNALSDRVQNISEIQKATIDKLNEIAKSQQPDKETIIDNIKIGMYEYDSVLTQYPEYRNDPDVVMAAIEIDMEELKNSDLKSDRNFILQVLETEPNQDIVKYMDSKLFADQDIAEKLMEINPNNYKYLASYHPDNKEMLKTALKNSSTSFDYIDPNLLDKELVLEAVKINPGILNTYNGNKYNDDRDIILEAVKTDGLALRFASNELKDDFEVVLTAMKNNVYAFSEASERLHDHYGLAIMAAQDISNIRFISTDLRSDPAFRDECLDVLQHKQPLSEFFINRYFSPINTNEKTPEDRENEKKMLQDNDPHDDNTGGRSRDFDMER